MPSSPLRPLSNQPNARYSHSGTGARSGQGRTKAAARRGRAALPLRRRRRCRSDKPPTPTTFATSEISQIFGKRKQQLVERTEKRSFIGSVDLNLVELERRSETTTGSRTANKTEDAREDAGLRTVRRRVRDWAKEHRKGLAAAGVEIAVTAI